MDEDNNGIMGPNERPLPGVKVLLGTKETLTDKEGWYLFDNLSSGTYLLAMDKKSLPAGKSAPSAASIVLTDEPVTLSDRNIPIGLPSRGISEDPSFDL